MKAFFSIKQVCNSYVLSFALIKFHTTIDLDQEAGKGGHFLQIHTGIDLDQEAGEGGHFLQIHRIKGPRSPFPPSNYMFPTSTIFAIAI